jgi:hypothetical protein
MTWGRPLVTVDGKIYWYPTESYALWNYIKGKTGLKYVLLIGDYPELPSFPFRMMPTGTTLLYEAVSELPLWVD